jgi:hypothetical protein
VRIQTLWRLVHAKKRVRRLKKLHSDARLLTRRLHRLCKKHRFHIKYIWEQQRTPYVVRMQALMRGAVARMRHARLLSAKRKAFETNRFITTRLNQLLAATQLQLIRDSMTTPIGRCMCTYCCSSLCIRYRYQLYTAPVYCVTAYLTIVLTTLLSALYRPQDPRVFWRQLLLPGPRTGAVHPGRLQQGTH